MTNDKLMDDAIKLCNCVVFVEAAHRITPDGQINISCPVLRSKIFHFTFDPNHLHISSRPTRYERGVSRSSRTLGRDAMDAGSAADESACLADGEAVWA